MNGKFILLLVISLNIVSIIFALGLIQAGNEVLLNNFVLEPFLKEKITSENINDLSGGGSIQVSDSVASAVADATKQESAGASDGFGFFAILDALKMIRSFIVILTPIPILSFFAYLDIPLWVTLIIGFPLVIFYFIALIEFIGNRKF
jgi:hypothetical protein